MAYKILVGSNDLHSGGFNYTADKFVIHPKYFPYEPAADIALIRVNETIKFSEKVKPVAFSNKQVPIGSKARAFGWGLMVFNFDISQNSLQIYYNDF